MARSAAAIAAHAISFQFDDGRVLFENLDFALGSKRYGLVGRNGIGKSILAQVLAGRRTPSSGRVERRGSIGFLPQNAADLVRGSVADALGATARLAALERIEAGGTEAVDFEAVGEDWMLKEDLHNALRQLGLSAALSDPVERFSGGERTRLALLGLALSHPEFLILDEPTNHLDRGGRRWLTERLTRWPGGALLVTHDRELLANVDRILELNSLGLVSYGGNYSLYRAQKDAEDVRRRRTLSILRKQHRRASAAPHRRGKSARPSMILADENSEAPAARTKWSWMPPRVVRKPPAPA